MNPLVLMGLDILVVLTLLYAVYYMRIVAKSVLVIRQGKSELQQVLKEMNVTIAKAEETINGMKRLAEDRGRFLQKQMDSANSLTEELKFINQAANTVAQRLEKNTTSGASKAPKELASQHAAPVKSATPATGASKAEKDLAAALAKRKSEAL